ncbi:hypothetical protein ACK350_07110 [Aeromonas veronii]
MLLITSAAYVDGELASEFGNIPPCCLPIGNKRLYEHQVKLACLSGINDVYISLPSDFQLSKVENEYLCQLGVGVILVPNGLSLGESVAYCWSAFEGKYQELRVLHGDTLYLDNALPTGDVVFTSHNKGYYHRAVITNDGGFLGIDSRLASESEIILSGYFSFSNGHRFIKNLHKNNFNFINSIIAYNQETSIDSIVCDEWLDFGHVTSYYRSRASMTTQRVFNGLKITNNTVIKSSNNNQKMLGEFSWFKKIPDQLKVYCPNALWYKRESDISEYAIEYIYASSLADLFVYGRHNIGTWEHIFRKVHGFICSAKSHSVHECCGYDYSQFNELYLPKTIKRLNEYSSQSGFDIYKDIVFNGKCLPSLMKMAEVSNEYIMSASVNDASIIHGDLCFSNILYEFRSENIKIIDPRGIDNNNRITIVGDRRYDLAKFAHSVIGLYDYIIAGKYTSSRCGAVEYSFQLHEHEEYDAICNMFKSIFLNGDETAFKELMAINVHLFLSMLPLHCDDNERQTALMLNGARLFDKYFQNELDR